MTPGPEREKRPPRAALGAHSRRFAGGAGGPARSPPASQGSGSRPGPCSAARRPRRQPPRGPLGGRRLSSRSALAAVGAERPEEALHDAALAVGGLRRLPRGTRGGGGGGGG